MHEPFTTDLSAGAPFGTEEETLPERAPPARETARVGRAEVVVGLLEDIRRTLGATPEGKARRMLLRKLESLQFVVDCWGAIPPRSEQVSAMLETLLKLQEAAAEARALAR